MKNELITFKDGTLELNVPVSWEQETVWITRNQIPMDGKQDYDVLGFIYEYLISNFAVFSVK